MRRALACLLLTTLMLPLPGAAATITVGSGGDTARFSEAVRMAKDGDTIAVLPGEYMGDVAVITQRRLHVRGVGARPVFHAAGRHAEGKSIWVVRAGEVTIENIEFRGARVPDKNGAGLRVERGRVTVRGCAFHDNENGVLTSNAEDVELRIEASVFSHAPRVASLLHHLLYAGRIGKLSVVGSRFHDGYFAHLIKSRARETRILNNLMIDGPTGRAAYEIDLPNGGRAEIAGNVIHQAETTTNPVLVSYGTEGNVWPDSRLYLAHNTLVSDARLAWFLRVAKDKLPPDAPVHVINNLTIGAGSLNFGNPGEFFGNYPALAMMLVDIDGLAYELGPQALLRGIAKAAKAGDGTDLTPRQEFHLPIGTRPVPDGLPLSPGAFQR